MLREPAGFKKPPRTTWADFKSAIVCCFNDSFIGRSSLLFLSEPFRFALCSILNLCPFLGPRWTLSGMLRIFSHLKRCPGQTSLRTVERVELLDGDAISWSESYSTASARNINPQGSNVKAFVKTL